MTPYALRVIRSLQGAVAAVALTLLCGSVAADDGDATATAELLFRDFFQMPVGPQGLQPSPRLTALNGQTVRIRGYMVHQDAPSPGLFILSPLPVALGDADESLSDDLPPAVVFVHFDGPAQPYVAGLLQVTGMLSVGAHDERDGHVSQVRLRLDAAQFAAAIVPLSPNAEVSPQAPGRSP